MWFNFGAQANQYSGIGIDNSNDCLQGAFVCDRLCRVNFPFSVPVNVSNIIHSNALFIGFIHFWVDVDCGYAAFPAYYYSFINFVGSSSTKVNFSGYHFPRA